MSKDAIKSTTDSLAWIYGVVIALSIGQAFVQFASATDAAEPQIRWDRLPSLLSFLLLVIPFYHGMARHFHESHNGKKDLSRHGIWLLTDCLVFTIEAGLFFVMGCCLSIDHWLCFNLVALILLFLDALWGTFVSRFCKNDSIRSWVLVNLCAIPLLIVIMLCVKKEARWYGASLAFLIILGRTIADYWTGWDFYFPKIEEKEM